MMQNKKMFDILLVESSQEIIMLFEELSKIFNLTIAYAKNITDFIELVTVYEFKFVLSNMHIEYKFGGLFLSRMFTNIRKVKINDGKMFLYSLQNNSNFDLSKLSLDDLAEEKFSNFYSFLSTNFPNQFFSYFTSPEYQNSIPVAI